MTEYIMLHTIVIQCSSSFIVISKVTEAKLFLEFLKTQISKLNNVLKQNSVPFNFFHCVENLVVADILGAAHFLFWFSEGVFAGIWVGCHFYPTI